MLLLHDGRIQISGGGGSGYSNVRPAAITAAAIINLVIVSTVCVIVVATVEIGAVAEEKGRGWW